MGHLGDIGNLQLAGAARVEVMGTVLSQRQIRRTSDISPGQLLHLLQRLPHVSATNLDASERSRSIPHGYGVFEHG